MQASDIFWDIGQRTILLLVQSCMLISSPYSTRAGIHAPMFYTDSNSKFVLLSDNDQAILSQFYHNTLTSNYFPEEGNLYRAVLFCFFLELSTITSIVEAFSVVWPHIVLHSYRLPFSGGLISSDFNFLHPKDNFPVTCYFHTFVCFDYINACLRTSPCEFRLHAFWKHFTHTQQCIGYESIQFTQKHVVFYRIHCLIIFLWKISVFISSHDCSALWKTSTEKTWILHGAAYPTILAY